MFTAPLPKALTVCDTMVNILLYYVSCITSFSSPRLIFSNFHCIYTKYEIKRKSVDKQECIDVESDKT